MFIGSIINIESLENVTFKSENELLPVSEVFSHDQSKEIFVVNIPMRSSKFVFWQNKERRKKCCKKFENLSYADVGKLSWRERTVWM